MARTDKAAAVAELTEEFKSSAGAVLTEYRGLTVAQLRELRGALGDDVKYAVVKNTLTKIAAKDAGVEVFDALLEGPSAIAFIKGDPVLAAKGLRDFAKAHPRLVIKGGVLDGKALDPDEITKLADLESREVLLAKLAGAMKAAPQQAVSLFAAPLSQAARLFAALQDTLPADGAAPVQDDVQDEVQDDVQDEVQDDVQDTVQDEVQDTPAEASTEESAPADA